MAEKFGSEFARDMLDRGRRELGGAFYNDSNVAQPMYPLRGGYEPPKEAAAIENDRGSILGERLQLAEASRDDHGRDDKDKGLDKE
jgi:hypothetical protein